MGQNNHIPSAVPLDELHTQLDASGNFKYGLPLGLRNILSFGMDCFKDASPWFRKREWKEWIWI
jgi:hypothetical protein